MRSRTSRANDDSRSQLVTDLGGSPYERLFLADPLPLARQQPQPDVAGIPGKRGPDGDQFSEPVVENLAGGCLEEELLRRRKPVDGSDVGEGLQTDSPVEPTGDGVNVNVVRHRDFVPPEAHRPSCVRIRQVAFEARFDSIGVAPRDEQLELRSPAMIGRSLGVEPEDVGPFTEAGR
jgi:hypothetical protein